MQSHCSRPRLLLIHCFFILDVNYTLAHYRFPLLSVRETEVGREGDGGAVKKQLFLMLMKKTKSTAAVGFALDFHRASV